MSNILALIPARGGSKRIFKKNIKNFLGSPIIKYSIDAAYNSNLFDEIMVSTDDKEIEKTSIENRALVPFLRSKKNSNDYATTTDVILEVINQYKSQGKYFDYICCIYPAAPLINYNKIIEGYKLLKKNNFNTVLPVVRYTSPIQRALKFYDGKITLNDEANINKRSQDLEKKFYDAGQFYWIETKSFLKVKKIFSKNSGAIILSEFESQDIDNEIDWKMAEIKVKIKKGIL